MSKENKKQASGPAFPRPMGNDAHQTFNYAQIGMSKRFYAAVAITQGIMADNENILNMAKQSQVTKVDIETFIAISAYKLADELLIQEKNYDKK